MNEGRAEVRFIARNLRPERGLILLSLGVGLVSALLGGIGVSLVVPVFMVLWREGAEPVALPAIVERLVGWLDGLVPGQPLAKLVVAILAVFLFRSAARLVHAALSHSITHRLGQRLRGQVMGRIVRADLAFHAHSHAGDHFNRISPEVTRAAQAAGQAVLGLERALTAVVLSALLFAISWKITLVAAALFALVAAANALQVRRIRSLGARFYDTSVEFSRAVVETVTGIRLIKTLEREEEALAELERRSDARERTLYEYNLRHAALGPVNDVLGMAGLIALAFIARGLFGGEVAALSAAAFVYLVVLLYLVPQLIELNRILGTVMHTRAGIEALAAFVDAEAAPTPQGGRRHRGLRQGVVFEDVSFAYGTRSRPALEGVSFAIPRGAVVALVGPSGAGKSTIADLLARFMDPTAGRILVDGTDLRAVEPKSWRAALGIVSQDTFLFHDTILANVAYARPGASRAEVEEALRRAHAGDFVRELPEGLETVVGDRGVRLSGGERQRIAIGRALLRDPEVLIMDEATNALDPLLDHALQDALRTLMRGRTVLYIAHRLSSLRASDHVLVLEGGRIAEQGSPEELLRDGRRFGAMNRAFMPSGIAS